MERSELALLADEGSGSTTDHNASLRLWIALARAYGTVYKAVSQRVADYELTTAQFGVLEALYHIGPLSLGDLAEKLLVTGGNVTYVMDRLQREGLVTRRRCATDRRVVWAELTDDGRELIEHVFPFHAEHIGELMSALDPSERLTLRILLEKLGASIQKRDESAATKNADNSHVALEAS